MRVAAHVAERLQPSACSAQRARCGLWAERPHNTPYSVELTRAPTRPGLIVTSALIIWKSLMVVTGSESPVRGRQAASGADCD